MFAKSLLLLSLFMCAGLTGCNNSDPYGDQDISGDILEPSEVDPLNPSSTAYTQIALFAGKPVKGLYYVCADARGTRDYVHTVTSTTTDDDGASTTQVTPVPVALCGNDATSVTFYLGQKESTGTKKSVPLGTAAMPVFSPVGSDGKPRYCNDLVACGTDSYGGISNSKFLFNFSLADLQIAPARLDVNNSFNPDGTCKIGKEKSCQAAYLQALLQALDSNKGTGNEIVIPIDANNALAVLGNVSPLKLDYPSYATFKAAWDTFVQSVCNNGSVCNGLPSDSTPMTEFEQPISQTSSRLNAGNYSLDYSGQLTAYAGYYTGGPNFQDFVVKDPTFTVNFMAYPDGYVSGFGTAALLTGSGCVKPTPTTPIDGVADYVICVILSIQEKNYVVAVGSALNNASISTNGQVNNLKLLSLTGNDLDLDVVGRVIAGFVYDGRIPPSATDRPSDFTMDYPTNTASSGNFVLQDSDKGSLSGSFFSVTMPASPGGSVGTTGIAPNLDPLPFPVRISKSGGGQTTPLDTTVLQQLSGQYYRLELMRFCSAAEEPACTATIPTAEIGGDSSANYPAGLCMAYEADGTTCQAGANFVPSKEKPRATKYGSASTSVNLRFDTLLPGSESLNLTLLDATCQPVRDARNQAIRVGTVIATPPSDNSRSIGASADISLLFAPPDQASVSAMPNLGTSLIGRISLDDPTWPVYRLGDNNFLAGIRAHWSDPGYQMTTFLHANGVTTPAQYRALSDDLRQQGGSVRDGAVQGQKLDNTCTPVP